MKARKKSIIKLEAGKGSYLKMTGQLVFSCPAFYSDGLVEEYADRMAGAMAKMLVNEDFNYNSIKMKVK